MKSQFKLYEINQMLRDAIDSIDINEETGEITELDAEFLDAIEIEREKKTIQCALMAQELKSEADAVFGEIKRLHARKKALDAKHDNLREYISYCMRAGEKIKDHTISISCKEIDSYNIIDETELPERYFKIKKEVSRSEISKDLDHDVIIPGIEVFTKKSITIR